MWTLSCHARWPCDETVRRVSHRGVRFAWATMRRGSPRLTAEILLPGAMPPAPFDRRLTPVRPDLAAAHLRGFIAAPRYVEGRAMQVVEASAPLRRSPQADAPLETEALYGETVKVYDESEGWAWAQLDRDQYVGYLPLAALGAPTPPTHWAAALRTHAYPGQSRRLPPSLALSPGARPTIGGQEGET